MASSMVKYSSMGGGRDNVVSSRRKLVSSLDIDATVEAICEVEFLMARVVWVRKVSFAMT